MMRVFVMGNADGYGSVDHLAASATALDALVARARVVTGCFAGAPEAAGSGADPTARARAALDALDRTVTDACPDVERRLATFFLAVGGRLLDDDDLSALAFEYSQGSPGTRSLVALLPAAVRRRPGLVRDASSVELVPARSDGLLIDVTHTERWPTMSGVQRVVRRTCEELRSSGTSFQLVRHDPERGAFVLLDEARAAAFLALKSATPRDPAPGVGRRSARSSAGYATWPTA